MSKIITAMELVAFVLKAAKEKWGYVLGGNGELYTPSLALRWSETRNKPSSWRGTKYEYFVEACAHWFEHIIVDCSGLIIAACRFKSKAYPDQKADTLYSHCIEKGPISTIPNIPGLCVWKKGHIGVYVGDGKVVESRGYKYGVVVTAVKSRPWTNWGKLADVDYSMLVVPQPKPEPKPVQYRYVYNGATYVNLRESAPAGKVVALIRHGEFVIYLNEKKTIGATEWWKVKHLKSGKTGWCAYPNLFKKV